MLENMNFYHFMHRQILVVIGLFISTGAGYLYMGWLYGSLIPESIWFAFLAMVSMWGYRLHRVYADRDLTMMEKEKWLRELRYFLFIYFSMWTIIFFIYISKSALEMHYMAIATQLGVTVVSATILVSQRKLAYATLITLMLPLMGYFIAVNEFYSYLLAFFTVVLSGVLLYASSNTFSYLVKSQYQAYHDYLTTLGNRRYFIELVEDTIKAQSNQNKFMYMLLIDLDHFKSINDTLGHDVGDDLLREVAKRMAHLAKQNNNHISRLGGDEFCLLSAPFDTLNMCLKRGKIFAETLLATIKETYIIQGHHLYISASIGLSVINKPEANATTFIKEADIAMYEAKTQGRDGVMIFSDDLSKRVERKLEIERLLHFALKEGELHLHYQPQYNADEVIVGCEVLVRWKSAVLGNVGPDEFIPIAEQTGMILEIGQFILIEAFKTFAEWDEKGIILEQMSINISIRQLLHHDFISDIRELIQGYLSPDLCRKLIFEVTETVVADDLSTLVDHMLHLKELGIRFSIDDFGTGYSSLSYLRQIPFDELKIDRSFIASISDSSEGCEIVETIVGIAKILNMILVAEGVETSIQKEFLVQQGCHMLQGYYFSKPVSKNQFENLEWVR